MRKRVRSGGAVEKAVKTSERVNEIEFEHSDSLMRRKDLVYLLAFL